VADFDADGDLDVLAGIDSDDGSAQAFYYFRNRAGAGNTPNFAAPVQNPFGLSKVGNSKHVPSAADLDLDGDLDLLVGTHLNSAQFFYFENTAGAGSTPAYAASVRNPFGLSHADAEAPSVADLNADGYPDVLAGGFPGPLYFFKQRASLIVNSTSDADQIPADDDRCYTGNDNANGEPECTLRAAINLANFDPGPDIIYFDIPTGFSGDPNCRFGTCTITPDSPLPIISDLVIIDGSTQPGSEGVCTSAILDRPTYGIALNGTNAGTSSGLNLSSGGSGSIIRGLNIHAFERHGIDLNGSTNNHIACNFIGTNADGSAAFPNLIHGLRLNNGAARNIIGTDGDGVDDAFEGNLISGNGLSGMRLAGGNSNIIAGNFIGTNRAGTQALGNSANGIVLDNSVSFNRIGTNGNGTSDAEERNLVSGNTEHGVLLNGSGTSSNAVAGNYIGADIGGAALGNGIKGVHLDAASNNRIGFAGTGPGSSGSQANLIRNNTGHGIQIVGSSATNNRVRGNQTVENTLLGVDLVKASETDPVTPNDLGDLDEGPNRLQNNPEFASVVLDQHGDLTLTYLVDTAPPSNAVYPLHIDMYLADSDDEEGQTWLGGFSYETENARTLVATTLSPAVAVAEGEQLVATATDADGNTSEFSAAVGIAVASPLFTVNATDDEPDMTPGDGFCVTGQTNSAGETECTLRAAIEEANAFAGADSIHFAIPASDLGCSGGTCVIQPTSALPDITSVILFDGSTQPGSESVCRSAIPARPIYGIALDGTGAGFSHGLRLAAG
ncbi:MAG TPA: FG-GAP-like repeat-containing protein, partial [Rhodothermales bacterium]|nr:FG-GAP-like repeat-containing protein [Rhodothermales bacterium]